ncbi:uncharacterized protein SEPMUDRAFT_123095 [Sphaerulina musiva SO2202]|uniref:Uncharacterized protein n=1 Tax=Sphaerulina musiva (strain SO2202) TaxID=692275 RepID=N1QKP6_SPHMS|nr:uncharacterized protein SEPMUDRAFT_123095 [Sphaerulina musiva SO2202]EMF17755.1 hypothetical protein SEPMUDRAFT_123095 [Sphaerulina musiva SO2202]
MKRKHADALKVVCLSPVFHSVRQLGSRTWLKLKGVPMATPKQNSTHHKTSAAGRKRQQQDGVWCNLVGLQSRMDLTM